MATSTRTPTDVVYEMLRQHVSSEMMPDVEEDAKLVLRDLWSLHKVPTRLPCTNPCSLMRSDLGTLATYSYRVGAKTDGIRFFLLFAHLVDDQDREHEYAVLIDRAFSMFPVHVLHAPPAIFEGTLFDGELVKHGDALTFVAFDTVASCGYSFKSRPHSERIAELSRILPRIFTASVAFDVKPWLFLTPEAVYQLTQQEQVYNSDGLIFVAESKELVVGMQRDMFKWKPASLHTIDFTKRGPDLFLVDGQSLVDARSSLGVVPSPASSWSAEYENSVVECTCHRGPDGTWVARPLKPRVDKRDPNSIFVARLTLQNIEEDITAEELARMLTRSPKNSAKFCVA